MYGYLNPESKGMQLFYKTTEMILLSVLWILASLPIVTMGAASSALYYAVVKVIRNREGYAWNEFWRGFRINFMQATKLWIPSVVLLAGLVADIIIVHLMSVAGMAGRWTMIIFALIFAFGLMWLIYIFAYIARFEDKIKTVLFNTVWMTLFHFVHSLLLLTVLVIMFGLVFLFPIVLPFAVFFFPGLYGVIAASVLESRFKLHMPKEETDDPRIEEDDVNVNQ